MAFYICIISIIFLTAEGEINANYHRINVSGTGQRESSTLTANMNNFRVRAHNNGDLLVRHVADDTDDTETPEVSEISHTGALRLRWW